MRELPELLSFRMTTNRLSILLLTVLSMGLFRFDHSKYHVLRTEVHVESERVEASEKSDHRAEGEAHRRMVRIRSQASGTGCLGHAPHFGRLLFLLLLLRNILLHTSDRTNLVHREYRNAIRDHFNGDNADVTGSLTSSLFSVFPPEHLPARTVPKAGP